MNFYSPTSQMFLLPGQDVGNGGGGTNPPIDPVYPSQIKSFDVFYVYEPVVGVQVLGYDDISAPLSIWVTDE